MKRRTGIWVVWAMVALGAAASGGARLTVQDLIGLKKLGYKIGEIKHEVDRTNSRFTLTQGALELGEELAFDLRDDRGDLKHVSRVQASERRGDARAVRLPRAGLAHDLERHEPLPRPVLEDAGQHASLLQGGDHGVVENEARGQRAHRLGSGAGNVVSGRPTPGSDAAPIFSRSS